MSGKQQLVLLFKFKKNANEVCTLKWQEVICFYSQVFVYIGAHLELTLKSA